MAICLQGCARSAAKITVTACFHASNVIVFRRSMASGYADVQNRLVFRDNSASLFGDAGDRVEEILDALG